MPDDLHFAHEIDRLAAQGDFNPFSLVVGEPVFHSVFLAPLTASLEADVQRFLDRGEGPLADLVERLRKQGEVDPVAAARAIIGTVNGVLVVVLEGDHGIGTLPFLFHGSLVEDYRRHVIGSCGEKFPDPKGLADALLELERQAQGGSRWPALVAGPRRGADPTAHWQGLGRATVATLRESIFPGGRERLTDLAFWCQSALALLLAGRQLRGPEALDLVRLQLLAGAIQAAGDGMLTLIEAGAVEEEEAAELLAGFVDGSIRAQHETEAAAWLEASLARIDARLGSSYETALACFRLHAAAGATAATLIPAAARLAQRNRKAMRQDLTREPVWAVRAAIAGDLLETATAAEAVGLPVQQVAKRLEKGTIPSCRDGDRLRIPQRPLQAWKAVMDAHGLLA